MRSIIALLAVLATGCSTSTIGDFERIPAQDIPFGLASPISTTTTTTTTVPATETATDVVEQPIDLYFVLSSAVIRVQRNVASPASVAQALALLAEGPANDPSYAGLRTALPADFRAEVQVTRGVALVDATRSFLTALQPADQRLAIAQIVLTLTSRPGVGQVLFRVDGESIAVPRGRGDIVGPGTSVTFDDYANLVTVGQ